MDTLIHAKDCPWLAFPFLPKFSNQETKYLMGFESVLSNQVYCGSLPQTAARGSKINICGSSSGFLIMVDEASEIITMMDPLTKHQVQAPGLSTSMAPNSSLRGKRKRQETQNYFIHKAVLSSSPDCDPYDYILMVIYGEKKELAYYNTRTQTWIKLQEAGCYYEDIIFYSGSFYAVDEYGKVIDFQSGSHPSVVEIKRLWLLRGNKVYFVIINDKPCVVVRFLKDSPTVGYETYKFEVWLLESYEEHSRIVGLKDWAIFVGQNESIALAVEGFDGLKGNCIYFTDDNSQAHKYGVIGGHDIGVYDDDDESFKPLNCFRRYSDGPRPVWVTPDKRCLS